MHAFGLEDFEMSGPEIECHEGADGQLFLSHSFLES
jgi:hypothetical protein